MDRSFAIAHISDLHLDGSKERESKQQTLMPGLKEKMADFRAIPDRLVIIMGDPWFRSVTPERYLALYREILNRLDPQSIHERLLGSAIPR
jgi:hypothetical protein